MHNESEETEKTFLSTIEEPFDYEKQEKKRLISSRQASGLIGACEVNGC